MEGDLPAREDLPRTRGGVFTLLFPARIHMHHAVLDRGEGSLDLLVDAFGDRVCFGERLVRIGGDLHVDVAS